VKKAALTAAICSILALSGCSDLLPGGKEPVVIGSSSTDTSSEPSSTAPAQTTPQQTTPVAADPVPGPTAPPGKVFTDPKGAYSMTLNKRWVPIKDESKGPMWYIGTPDNTYRPLVNIVTEPLIGPNEGIGLKTYMQLSAKNLQKAKFTVVKQGALRGVNADQLGAIEYTKGALRFLVLIDVSRTNAAVVTMTSTPRTFKQQRAAAQPYMATIKAAD
jgi:hypothetical protein